MPSKAKLAIATLLVFGSASAVLAESTMGAIIVAQLCGARHHRLCSNSATLLRVMP